MLWSKAVPTLPLVWRQVFPILATLAVVVPSAVRLYRRPTHLGLSAGAVGADLVGSTSWLVYSLWQGLGASAVSSALLVGMACATLRVAWRGARRGSWVPAGVLAATLLTAAASAGTGGVAVVLGVAPMLELPQVVRARREDVPALSVAGCGLVLLRTLPWAPYALHRGDVALGLWVVTCSVVKLALFVVLLRRRVRSGTA